jgi:23S rRNA pseudouridine2605 synthase
MGYCSRSRAAELIRAGRVRLNGHVRRDPEWPVHPGKDRIEVEGERVEARAFIYLAMNKPRGLVTTASDEKGRETIYSLLDPQLAWVAPVGRLDKSSEGLLLLTNDSEWSQSVLDPASHLDKTYHVQIGTVADESLLERLRRGISVDGERLRAKHVSLLRTGQRNCWLEIVLDEGRNRQIRRMLDSCRIEVLRLMRVAIGPIALGELAKGKVRNLATAEKKLLDGARRL